MSKLERILHVDDDEDIRTLTKMALELVGKYQVEQFPTGEAALEHPEGLTAQLFLLDYMMPGMSGEELWRRLKEVPGLETVPVVFMTAKTEAAFAQRLMNMGALAVIMKPFEISELSAQIAQIWDKHQVG
jgi:DNA-binding response OmpR family regulator